MEYEKRKKAVELAGAVAFGLAFAASVGLNIALLVQPERVTELCGMEKSEALAELQSPEMGKPKLFFYSGSEYEKLLQGGGVGLNKPLPHVDCDEVIQFGGGSTLIYLFIKDGKVVRMAERGT